MTALVRWRRGSCPDCRRRLRSISWQQPAMFSLYGFGHTEQVTLVFCRCGYLRHQSTTTLRPDPRGTR